MQDRIYLVYNKRAINGPLAVRNEELPCPGLRGYGAAGSLPHRPMLTGGYFWVNLLRNYDNFQVRIRILIAYRCIIYEDYSGCSTERGREVERTGGI